MATRSLTADGLGLDVPKSLANAANPADRMRFLDESAPVVSGLRKLLEETDCSGARIHDANVVAIALAHGLRRTVTANVVDFRPFASRVQVHDPADAAGSGP